MTINHLHYSHGTETGALFHMIGALSQFGKVGLTAIGGAPPRRNHLRRGDRRPGSRDAGLTRFDVDTVQVPEEACAASATRSP